MTDAETTVRRIGRDDGPTLREVRLRALRDAPGAFGQTMADAQSRPMSEWVATARAASSGDSRAWFLAVRWGEDLPVGLVQTRRRPPHTALVFSMWVAPRERRRGTGARLIEAAAAWGRGWGAGELVLWVIAGNDGAVRFYERLGFRTISEGPDADSGRSYSAVAMRLELSAGDQASSLADSKG